jgi:hypothetical protein
VERFGADTEYSRGAMETIFKLLSPVKASVFQTFHFAFRLNLLLLCVVVEGSNAVAIDGNKNERSNLMARAVVVIIVESHQNTVFKLTDDREYSLWTE